MEFCGKVVSSPILSLNQRVLIVLVGMHRPKRIKLLPRVELDSVSAMGIDEEKPNGIPPYSSNVTSLNL